MIKQPSLKTGDSRKAARILAQHDQSDERIEESMRQSYGAWEMNEPRVAIKPPKAKKKHNSRRDPHISKQQQRYLATFGIQTRR